MAFNPAEALPKVGPPTTVDNPALFQQSQFQQNLAQTLPVQQASVQKAMPIQPASEVRRATTQTASLGERILQNLSAVHRGNAPAAANATGPSLVNGKQAGPAEQSLLQPGGAGPRMPAKPHDADNFESMVATLQNVYNNVIQVSLVSKSTGSFSSSLNKLVSAG
jgi:hypothetical protein